MFTKPIEQRRDTIINAFIYITLPYILFTEEPVFMGQNNTHGLDATSKERS